MNAKRRQNDRHVVKPAEPPGVTLLLLDDIHALIRESRSAVAVAVNSAMSMLYWQIGRRINNEILKGERAEYGKEIIATLSKHLVIEYGGGFAEKNLRRMIQFAQVFPDEQIVVSLIRHSSWTHFLGPYSPRKALAARILRRDVPHREMERTDPAAEDWLHAL